MLLLLMDTPLTSEDVVESYRFQMVKDFGHLLAQAGYTRPEETTTTTTTITTTTSGSTTPSFNMGIGVLLFYLIWDYTRGKKNIKKLF